MGRECLCSLRFVCQYKEYFTDNVGKLSKIDDTPLADNTILCELKTATTKMGKITFDKEFISLCAKAVADYIKNNPIILQDILMD